MSFRQVIDTVEQYIAGQHTYFVLENLDTFKKEREAQQSESVCGLGASDQTGDGFSRRRVRSSRWIRPEELIKRW